MSRRWLGQLRRNPFVRGILWRGSSYLVPLMPEGKKACLWSGMLITCTGTDSSTCYDANRAMLGRPQPLSPDPASGSHTHTQSTEASLRVLPEIKALWRTAISREKCPYSASTWHACCFANVTVCTSILYHNCIPRNGLAAGAVLYTKSKTCMRH